jgi:Zn-dependent membrane protease YugP
VVFDPLYFVFLAPALLLSLWASFKTKRAFNKYSKVRTMNGMTGAQAAKVMLDRAGIHDVEITKVPGKLTDHYNPMNKTLALSVPVHSTPSIAAVGVACHEAGHAIQHAKAYKPMWLRSILVKPAKLGSTLGFYGMMIGLMMSSTQLFMLGVILFSGLLAFQMVTLPVEFDASNRAKKLAVEFGIVAAQERSGMDKVLNAAALTYVAAAAASIMQLLYFLMRAGLLGGSRD